LLDWTNIANFKSTHQGKEVHWMPPSTVPFLNILPLLFVIGLESPALAGCPQAERTENPNRKRGRIIPLVTVVGWKPCKKIHELFLLCDFESWATESFFQ
jgi:hypothetical protein